MSTTKESKFYLLCSVSTVHYWPLIIGKLNQPYSNAFDAERNIFIGTFVEKQ
jgi:hypothetical protein